jgi:catechol 2,3-dioxygenase-like lactoylglutathione lyase family enzyme
MKPVVDHIQFTVADMATALPFYDRLMPLLGFDPARRNEAQLDAHEMHVVEYIAEGICIGISSPRSALAKESVHRRRPGALHHLAFRAASRAEVDRFHEQLLELDADIVEPPRVYPQHGADYYAVFFKDPGGVKLEVMFEGPA